MQATTYRRALLLAVVVGLAARLAFAFGYWTNKPLTNDEREYLLLAQSLAAGRGFEYPDTPDANTVAGFGRAPAYPAFLAPIVGTSPLPPDVPAGVKVAQSLVGAIGVLLIGLLAGRVAGRRAAVWAALIAAVYPPLVWICAYALSEAVYSPLVLAAALLLVPLTDGREPQDRRREIARGLGAGAVIGAAALVRPAALALLGFAALWLLFRRSAAAVALVAGALVLIAPWTARNIAVHDRLILIASEGGITFWTGNHPLSAGEGDMAANPLIKEADERLRERHPGLSEADLERVYYQEALRAIAEDPLWWLGLLARKFFYIWVPVGPSYTLHSARYYGLTLVSYGLLFPFALAGFVHLLRRRDQPWALWLIGASAVIIPIVFLSTERYRIPVIDPLLIICAAAWLTRLWRRPA